MSAEGRDNDTSDGYVYNINDGVGYGLVQWTYFTRKQGLLDFASERGLPYDNMDTQLAYIYWELHEVYDFRNVWSTITSSNDIDFLTEYIEKNYELPVAGSTATRIQNAHNIYRELKGT